jgi:hypothetical protein
MAEQPLGPLDAAHRRIGEPNAARSERRYRRYAALAEEREIRERVMDDLIASDDSDLKLMSMLRGQDVQNSLIDESAWPSFARPAFPSSTGERKTFAQLSPTGSPSTMTGSRASSATTRSYRRLAFNRLRRSCQRDSNSTS